MLPFFLSQRLHVASAMMSRKYTLIDSAEIDHRSPIFFFFSSLMPWVIPFLSCGCIYYTSSFCTSSFSFFLFLPLLLPLWLSSNLLCLLTSFVFSPPLSSRLLCLALVPRTTFSQESLCLYLLQDLRHREMISVHLVSQQRSAQTGCTSAWT